MRTERQQKLTLVSGLVGEEESGSASTPFGPMRAGLTTTQTTHDRQLTELLNCLERNLAMYESKYFEACDTWLSATEHLVRLTAIINDTGGTDTLKA